MAGALSRNKLVATFHRQMQSPYRPASCMKRAWIQERKGTAVRLVQGCHGAPVMNFIYHLK